MSCLAELRNVTKEFDGRVAVENANVKIGKGEILALVGPNGSGKTTILRMLAFLEAPTRGEILFQGARIDPRNVQDVRLKSTMVFQRTVLFNSSVYDNVSYGLKVRKLSRGAIDAEVHNALRLVRLEDFAKRHSKKLSGGEQQRVALARALALNTELLLLDEPTANLDPRNVSVIEEIIAEVNRERGTTIVVATHNMFQARSLPHRIALMDEGKIAEIGHPSRVFGSLSKTLASFAAVENTFKGIARRKENGTSSIDVGKGIEIVAATSSIGEVSIYVSPEDIILSQNRFDSSARNVLEGKIVGVQDMDSLVRLKVDVGKVFVVQITKRSFNDMKLNLGSEVFITFKASNVHAV